MDLEAINKSFLYYRTQRMQLISEMIEVQTAYNNENEVPLPELHRNERSAIPNTTALGIDQLGSRIASTVPNPSFPPKKRGVTKWEEAAEDKRLAVLGMWEQNNVPRMLRRRARHILAYACTPVLLRPSKILNGPKWFVKSPLSCYPAIGEDPESITPTSCIFSFTRSAKWVQDNHPEAWMLLRREERTAPQTMFTLLEYVDAEEYHLILLSKLADNQSVVSESAYMMSPVGLDHRVSLSRIPNKAGICPAVVPGRVTLDRERSSFYDALGMHQAMAELFAYAMIATRQDVFKEQWLEARTNEDPKIIEVADSVEGIMGKVSGGTIQTVQQNPGVFTNPMIDRLYQYAKTTAGIPSDTTGESGSNIRTGRRGEQITGAQIDFAIQENQALLAESLQAENKVAIAIDKANFGPKVISVGWRGSEGELSYDPEKLWDSDAHTIRYAMLGSDQNQLIVGIGQRRGLELISQRTAMSLDPYVDDPESEMDLIDAEKIKAALFAAAVQPGAMQIPDLARWAELVIQDKTDTVTALLQVQKEAQTLQASSGPPGTPEGPLPAGSPEAQPGIVPPGAQQAPPTVGPVQPSIHNLASQLSALWPSTAAAKSA